jgi:hypothetical protein
MTQTGTQSFPVIFAKEADQEPGIGGLHYIALTLNPIYRHLAAEAGGVGWPEF